MNETKSSKMAGQHYAYKLANITLDRCFVIYCCNKLFHETLKPLLFYDASVRCITFLGSRISMHVSIDLSFPTPTRYLGPIISVLNVRDRGREASRLH